MTSSLGLGLVPVTRDPRATLALHEVAAELGAMLGCTVEPRLSSSPEELAADHLEGRAPLVWSSPVLALTTLRRSVPLACSVREGVAWYHSVLVVRRDGPIASPLDLRGKVAAWVARTSASGYLFPRIALAGHGLDPAGLFAKETFLGAHGAVVEAVLRGDADVAATFAVFEDGDATKPLRRAGHHDERGDEKLRVLLATPPIPSDLFVASAALARDHGPHLVRALTELGARARPALALAFGAEALVATTERELSTLRRQLSDAEALGLLELRPPTIPPAP